MSQTLDPHLRVGYDPFEFLGVKPVALGTVGMCKGKRKIGNSQVEWETRVGIYNGKNALAPRIFEVSVPLILSGTPQLTSLSYPRSALRTRPGNPATGYCIDLVRPREPGEEILQAGPINMPEVSLRITLFVTAILSLTPEAAGNVGTSIAILNSPNPHEGYQAQIRITDISSELELSKCGVDE